MMKRLIASLIVVVGLCLTFTVKAESAVIEVCDTHFGNATAKFLSVSLWKSNSKYKKISRKEKDCKAYFSNKTKKIYEDLKKSLKIYRYKSVSNDHTTHEINVQDYAKILKNYNSAHGKFDPLQALQIGNEMGEVYFCPDGSLDIPSVLNREICENPISYDLFKKKTKNFNINNLCIKIEDTRYGDHLIDIRYFDYSCEERKKKYDKDYLYVEHVAEFENKKNIFKKSSSQIAKVEPSQKQKVAKKISSPPFDLKAKSAILIDSNSNQVLYEKNPDLKIYPASMTKIMTTLIAFDLIKKGELELNDKFVVSEKAWRLSTSGYSSMFIMIGDRISVENLLRGIIVASGNDACVTLAEGIAGSEENFVKLMNKKAQIIGLKNTNFSNSTGINDPNNFSTVRDIANLSSYMIKNYPYYYKYYSVKEFTWGRTGGDPITQGNRNPLLYKSMLGVDGIKTGYLSAEKYQLASSMKLPNNERLIAVGSGFETKNARSKESAKLLTWAKNNYHTFEIAKKEKIITPKKKVEVAKAEEPKQEEFKPESKDIDKDAPIIEIAKNFTVDSQTYTLKGKVKDKSKFYLEANGRPVELNDNGNFKLEGFVVDPEAGEEIKIVAIDRWNNQSEKIVKIKVEFKEVADVRTYEQPNPGKIRVKQNKNKVALIIGIEKYKNLVNKDAPYANRDANAFRAYANRALGIPNKNIKVLIDEEATRGETLKALTLWLPQVARGKGKDIFVFFAGHGLASDDGKNLYLLPQDGDEVLLQYTALSRLEIFDLINKVEPNSVTMFFDTCYSGQTRDEEMLVAGLRPIRLVAEEQEVQNNFTIFTASDYNQTSGSIEEAKHGIFSYYLMRGMEGNADSNNDKKITNGELIAYLKENVSEEAFINNREQEPMLSGDPDKVLISYK